MRIIIQMAILGAAALLTACVGGNGTTAATTTPPPPPVQNTMTVTVDTGPAAATGATMHM
jgi:hypothetical protein